MMFYILARDDIIIKAHYHPTPVALKIVNHSLSLLQKLMEQQYLMMKI